MTATALTGPHIQARSYSRGRTLRERKAVNILVVHSAEGATDETSLGSFFSRATTGSSNCGIGQDGGYASYVNYADTAWANPPLNQESDNVELCGFARWTRAQWLAHPKMLETLARWLAWRAAVRRIPLVLLSAADVRAGKAGIADHRTVNAAHKASDHWDVGYSFPWDVVLPRAKQIAGVGGPVTKPATLYVVRKGDTLSAIASKYKTTVAALQSANGIKDPDRIAVGQRIKIVVAGPKVPPKPGVTGKFPYGRGHYFYTEVTDPNGHSGYWSKDRGYIAQIQRELGFSQAQQDGKYGPKTKAAVVAYQRKHGLSADGAVGPATWAHMAAS